MKRVLVRRVLSVADATRLVGKPVPEREPTTDEAAVYLDEETGEPVLLHQPYGGDSVALRAAVRRVPGSTVWRNGQGWQSDSTVFGMSPRKVHMQREACRRSELWNEHPDIHRALERGAAVCMQALHAELPEIALRAANATAEVSAEWRLRPDVVWTSGVVNRQAQLPYHRDAMNFRDCWSLMPVFRRGVAGGYLHLPEYAITVPCRDSWVVGFMGSELVHGVTPLRVRQRDGYRISIVYYALRGMKDCATYAMELVTAQERRSQREQRGVATG